MTCPSADRLTRSGLWLIAAMLAAGPARAGQINIDFNDATANAGSPTATFAGAAAIGQAGDQWNGLNLADGWGDTNTTKTYAGLVDASGMATGVSLKLTGERCAFPAAPAAPVTGTYGALMQDYVSYSPVFVISGLENGAYDVYVYSGTGSNGTSSGSVQVNGGTPRAFTSGLGGNALVADRDYLLFSATVTDGRLTINGVDKVGDVLGNLFAGFQIRSAWPAAIWSAAGLTDWGNAANWTAENGASLPPNAAGAWVTFKASGASSTVDLGAADRTVGGMVFNNSNASSVSLASAQAKGLTFDNGANAPLVTVNGSHTISADVKLSGDLAVKSNLATDTLSLNGTISNAGATACGLTKSGPGTLALRGVGTYTGVTRVNGGMLQIGKKAALYNAVLTDWLPDKLIVESGATLMCNVGGTGEMTINNVYTLLDSTHLGASTLTTGLKSGSFIGIDTTNTTNSAVYGLVIANPANGNTMGFIKNGNGLLQISGSNRGVNTYTGGTIVNGGTLSLGDASSTGNSWIRGTLTINTGGKVTFGNNLGNIGSADVRLARINLYGGTLDRLASGNSNMGGITLSMRGGTLAHTGGGCHQFATTNGGNVFNVEESATSSVVSGTIQFDTAQVVTVANGTAAVDLLVSGTVQGNAFVKEGPGAMALTAANTYAGATTVNAGTLLANNTSGSATSSGAVNVAVGGTFGGTGTITGTLNVSGALAPGGPGRSLSCGPVNLSAGATFRCDVDSSVSTSSGAPMLNLLNNGDLAVNGAISLVLNDIAATKKAFPVGTTYSLVHYTGNWSGGFFAYAGKQLSNGQDFTAGLNNWKIDYNVSTPGCNFSGTPTVGVDKFINLTAIPFAGSATVGNLNASALTATTATISGAVTAIGNSAPSITLFYGSSDGVTTPERWQHSVTLPGTYTGAFSLDLSALTLLTNYYFTVRATNSAGDSWVIPAFTFRTTAVPPAVATAAASLVSGTTASLAAEVVSNGGENPSVTVYYGTSDGGTNPSAWANLVSLGTGAGILRAPVAGLAADTPYFFRAYARNSGGGVWAPTSLGFSTLPVSLAAVENRSVDGITGTTAVLHGRVTLTGNDVPVITLFYGTTDGGTNPAAWASSIALGNLSGDFTRFLSGLSLNTPYFFRWRAVNAAGAAWAKDVGTFTTTLQIPSTVVINEIHCNGIDNTILNEFIEIYNDGPSATSLAGWRISGGIDYVFPADASVAAHGFVIVAANPATILAKYGKTALGPWTGSLSSEGENIRLRDSTNTVIDEVDYKIGFPWPVAAGGDGASLEKINPSLDGNLGGSWRSSVVPADNATADTVTPGAVNLQFAANAPPAIRQVQHAPQQPTSQDPIVITAKVTDPQGVTSVTLSYQVVAPGNYIPRYLSNVPSGNTIAQEARALNPAYELAANWTTVTMNDVGTNGDVQYGDSIYTAVLPAMPHRTLLRYRITVTDSMGASVRVPYADDPAANFACYIYNGVPAYGTTTAATLQTLPVYQLITKASDWADCVALADGGKQLSWNASRFYYNWNGTFVYDGVVYDHIAYRTRGANGRYQGSGKRSMRFKFNRGSYIALRDQRGNLYAQKSQTITTCKGTENSGSMTYSLNEWMNLRMWNAFGVPAPLAHFAHWRNVTTAAEQADNYHGDFQGLIMVQEDYDARFLDSHHMAKGNLYKLLNETDVALDQQRYQAPYGAKNGADHDWVPNINSSISSAALTANVNLDKWDRYHAICQAVRHYDYWPNCDKNMAYYFEPVYTAQNGYRGKLWILPYDHDASWGPSWNGGVDNVYDALFNGSNNVSLRPDYYNTIRECRNLLLQPDQINPLLDEIASYILPFQQADNARWQSAPTDVGNYSSWGGSGSVSIASVISAMKNFASNDRGPFMDQLGNSNGEDATKYPATPTITFAGTAGYQINDLRFSTSAFSDPQGAGTFGALQWRIAEVNTSATFTPGVKRLLEMEASHQSEELTTFASTYLFPASACEIGKRYRARVRHKDLTGRWSNWSAPAEFAATAVPAQTLIHYWNFNYAAAPLTPNWTLGGAALSVVGDYLSDSGESFTALNARNGDPADTHLRINNPLTAGTMATFAVPSSGFENLTVCFETRRSGQGAGIQNVSYTLNGTTYLPFATLTINNANPVVQTLDFRPLPQANNNPLFGIRITFAQGTGGTSGNNRIDNFTVSADPIAGQGLPKLLPGRDADWNTATNWANNSVPNAAAGLAIIGAPTATDRAVTLNAPVTIGSLQMDNAGCAFLNQITSALGTSLTFNGGGGSALLQVAGTGTGYIEFNLAGDVNLATDLRLNVSNIAGNHLANGDIGYGALRLRGSWTGTGGLIKQGLGVATLSGIGKTFSGPILVQQGVLSFTQPAVPAQAPSITVQDGGQIRLVSGNDEFGARIYTFGCPLVLAGTGRGAGVPNSQHEGVLGAMRYDPDIGGTNRAIVTTPVTLAADAEIHVDGPDNTLELAGPVGGTGSLIKSGGGPVVLSGDSNTYSGNTLVTTGSLSISHPNFATASTVTIGLAADSGSVLNLPNAGTSYVAALVINGVTMPNNLYGSTNSNGAITGLGKIQVGAVGPPPTLAGLTLSSGTLSPAFAAGTMTYTASVPNAITALAVTPTVTDMTATVKVNGMSVASGTASASIPLQVGTNPITVLVTAQNGVTQATYTVTVTRISNVSTLAGLTLNTAILSPEFATATTSYTASVANATTGLTVTPTVTDLTATVRVNGEIVTSGIASPFIPLQVGTNPITVRVTAQDGVTQSIYTVAVTRISNVASLAGLALSSGALSPAFDAGTLVYAAGVTHATTGVSITPTLTDLTATVRVNGTLVASGTASAVIPLVVGSSPITVSVTAQDGSTTSDYTITVTRPPSAVSSLSGLTLSSGTLSPAFATGTLTYTASVPNATTAITVTPTVTDPTATITVNGAGVTSGTASASIPLVMGANTVTVIVTAQDGTTLSTYTVTIPISGYAAWQARVFTNPADLNDPARSGELATPAHDGITNLMKYALALEPMTCGTDRLPTAARQGGYLTLTYRKNKQATDLTYTVQVADSLTGDTWVAAAAVVSQTDQGSHWLVTVQDTVPYAGHAQRFIRLRVSK